jgi:hypothetical protein
MDTPQLAQLQIESECTIALRGERSNRYEDLGAGGNGAARVFDDCSVTPMFSTTVGNAARGRDLPQAGEPAVSRQCAAAQRTERRAWTAPAFGSAVAPISTVTELGSTVGWRKPHPISRKWATTAKLQKGFF